MKELACLKVDVVVVFDEDDDDDRAYLIWGSLWCWIMKKGFIGIRVFSRKHIAKL